MQSREIESLRVSAIGLGSMGLSHAYGAPPLPERAEELLLRAIDLDAALFDTAALYGVGVNEELVSRALSPYGDRIVLANKGGISGGGWEAR